jgi:hypothetical protein
MRIVFAYVNSRVICCLLAINATDAKDIVSIIYLATSIELKVINYSMFLPYEKKTTAGKWYKYSFVCADAVAAAAWAPL